MKKIFILSVLFLVWCNIIFSSAPYATWTKTELVLNNGIVNRTIKLPTSEGQYLTVSYKPITGKFKYFKNTNPDFQFEANNVIYSGNDTWYLVDIKLLTDHHEGNGASVTLLSDDKKLEVTVKYLLYPNSPAIRKSIKVKNLTNDIIKLESVDIEKFSIEDTYPVTFSWIYHDYGRRKSIGPYEGNMHDALVIVHEMNRELGVVIGNESPGVTKRTSVAWGAPEICTGLTHKENNYPFRKWIEQGASFETPQVFTMVYNNQKTPDEILNKVVPEFTRKFMGIRLSELTNKPTFAYNTWNPFGENINEELIKEVARSAANVGVKEFIIDAGWEDVYGDWGVNKKKFPNGLKPVCDYIKSLGMKPGLWICAGTAAQSSKVYQSHPEWFIIDKKGKNNSLHKSNDSGKLTACFSTGWYDYIKEKLINLVGENGLEYLKIDFAVLTSAYNYDPYESGCYATDHPGHRDHNESLLNNFEKLFQLFDELHAFKPDLFIDCTFETMGGLQLIDYAMLKHAEGNWMSNFRGTEGEKTDIRIRNMAWWRSPAIPPAALILGNPQMQDKKWETHFKSVAGAFPIMLGDPRKLSEDDTKKYRTYSNWFQLMETKYNIMDFRQDLPGFGEPTEGMWDGFQRINTDTGDGGIIGIFRHGSKEDERVITINYLDPERTYEIKSVKGEIITSQKGSQLYSKGFTFKLNDPYSGELLEVSSK